MATGSCLCGAIRFEVDEAGIVLAVGCFCANCRKVGGAQSGVYFQVKRSAFRWICDPELVGTFESSRGNLRGFCRTCGSVAPIETAYGAVRVPGGAFDEDPGVRPQASIFASGKADWCDLGGVSRTFDDAGPASFWESMVIELHS